MKIIQKTMANKRNKQSSTIKLHDENGSLIALNVATKFNNLSITSNFKAGIKTRRTFDPG